MDTTKFLPMSVFLDIGQCKLQEDECELGKMDDHEQDLFKSIQPQHSCTTSDYQTNQSVESIQPVDECSCEIACTTYLIEELAFREKETDVSTIGEPGPYDVLCGRNHAAYNHIGNRYVQHHMETTCYVIVLNDAS